MVKVGVVSPVPGRRGIAAAAVCPGAFASMRPPYRMSRQNEPMTALLAGPDLQSRPEPRLSDTTVRLGKVLQAGAVPAAGVPAAGGGGPGAGGAPGAGPRLPLPRRRRPCTAAPGGAAAPAG